MGKRLGNTIDTASNAALKGKPVHNHHLKILKGLKLSMTLSKKKEKKDMDFLSKKRFGTSSVVPLIVPRGHLRSEHHQTYVQGF